MTLVGILERGARLVTVVRPDAVRSRVARAALAEWSSRGAAAVAVDLHGAEEGGAFAARLAGALGLTLPEEGAPADALLAAAQGLASRGPVVVLLDGFDGLTRYALVTLHRWGELLPQARFVVTASAPLGVPDEVTFSVEGTPSGDAEPARVDVDHETLSPLRFTPTERLTILDAALAHDPPPPQRAALLVSRAAKRRRLGRLAEALADLDSAHELARASSDDALCARSLLGRARVLVLLERLDEAAADLERALPLHRAAGDWRGETMDLSALGLVAQRRGDAATALDRAGAALSLAQAHGAAHAEAEQTWFLALLQQQNARLADARALFDHGARSASAAGDSWTAALCLLQSGLVALELGEVATARAIFDRAEPLLVGFDPRAEGLVLSHAAAARALEGELQDASWLFDRAERLLQHTDVALLPAVIGPERGLLDLARARRARSSGDALAASDLERRARDRLAAACAALPADSEASRGASLIDATRASVLRLLQAALAKSETGGE